MPTNVIMPKWGLSMQEGTILGWLKQEGEPVAKGEEIVEIESEKASNFVEAPASGVLARIVAPEGSTLPVTAVIAVIAVDGEDVAAVAESDVSPAQAAADTGPSFGKSEGPASDKKPAVEVKRPARGGRVPASPAARRLAKQHDLDLSPITGTGPDGMIKVEDVEAALKQSPSTAPVSKVAFYSRGDKLDGVLYLPKDGAADVPLPGIVFCLGFTYTKDLLVPEMARRLSAEGYASLIFDYRGFGQSEGARGTLLPLEQVADVRAAMTYLAQRGEVDENRISLVGISLGGSHAIYIAGTDERVHSVVAISPVGDCRRWLRSNRPYWQWIEWTRRIEEDCTARVLGHEGAKVDAWDIVAPDPESRRFLDELFAEFPALRCELSLESAAALLEYGPESVGDENFSKPLLLIHGECDLLVSPEESEHIQERLGGACELVRVPRMGHFDWAVPGDERFECVMQRLIDWFGRP